jgi:hypothetical protein
MLKRPLVSERREGRLLPTWRDRDESDGNMKVREKIRHGNGIGDRAGVKPKRRHWSWWCNDVTFSPRNGAPKPKAARRFNSPDCIHIPVPAQGRELSGFPMSVRLRHVLDFGGCRLLGDLHGLRFSEFQERRSCGQRTLQELKALVECVQHEALLQSNQPVNHAVILE